MARGLHHSLFLTDEGNVYGFWSSDYGQLGTSRKYAYKPRQIKGVPRIKSITSGNYQNLALDFSGRVWRWGSFEARTGKTIRLYEFIWNPKPAIIDKDLTKIKQIVSGEYAHLLLGEDNSLWFLEDKTTKHGVSIDRPRRLEFKNAKDWSSTDNHEWPIRDKKIKKILTGIQEMALFLAFTEDKECASSKTKCNFSKGGGLGYYLIIPLTTYRKEVLMKGYAQLTVGQRYHMYGLVQKGATKIEIAHALGVHKSTICRELKRNKGQRGWRPN